MSNRQDATGTDTSRDEYFLRKLAQLRKKSSGVVNQLKTNNPEEVIQQIRNFSQFRINAAVHEELGRIDATRTGLISVELRKKCHTHNLKLEHIGITIGTIIHNINLAEKLSNEVLDTIRQVLLERKVIFFRDQSHLTKEQHVSFGRCFGSLEIHPFSQPVKGYPEILRITHNLKRPPSINTWHSDVTWRTEPSLGSILLMRKKPTFGGDTLFADSHCQFIGLPDNIKTKVVGLSATHDFINFRNQQLRAGVPQSIVEEMTEHFPLAHHPVIRTHPETGKQSIYVNTAFTTKIENVSEKESKQLLRTLYDQSKIPEYQCRFKWEEGSIAFWDNRACQHYAAADYFPDTRTVERVTVCGDKPFFVPDAKESKL